MHKVSVVVPIFNVEDYLRECLDSVAAQTIDSIQVVMVDDGSTDGSGAIADEYAEKYPNFECHHIANQGLGHARNFGATFTDGEYLCFLDSDDVVPAYAYESMYELGEKHDCDLVVGDVVRFNSTKEYPSALHLRAFSNAPEVMHITTNPSLFNDTTAWNKLFRRDFYFRNGFSWAEGMLYEDIPVTIPAHILANRVAHLNQVVYKWRARDSGEASITQRRKELNNFTDRLKAICMVDAFFEDRKLDAELCMEKDFKWLDMDFKLYWNILPIVDSSYVEVFVDRVAEYLKRVDERVLRRLRAIDRISYYYIGKKDIKSFLSSLTFEKKGYKSIKIRQKRDGRFYGFFPFKDLPDYLTDMAEELSTRDLCIRVASTFYSRDGLHIRGEAFIPRLPLSSSNKARLEFQLFNCCNEMICNLPGRSIRVPNPYRVRVSRVYKSFHIENQAYRGFEVVIEDSILKALDEGDYYVGLKLLVDGVSCDLTRVGGEVPGHVLQQSAIDLGDSKVCLCMNAQNELRLEKRLINDRVEYCDITSESTVVVDGSEILPISLFEQNSDWRGCSYRAAYDYFNDKPSYCLLQNERSAIRIVANSCGELSLDSVSASPIVAEVAFSGPKIIVALDPKLTGDLVYRDVRLVGQRFGQMATLRHQSEASDVSDKMNTWTIDLSSSEAADLRSDLYNIVVTAESLDMKRSVQLLALNGLERRATSCVVASCRYEYSLSQNSEYIEIKSSYIPRFFEKTSFRRKFIQQYVYPAMRLLPIKKKWIVFESSWGNKTDCNPGALYRYFQVNHPEYRCVWSLKDTRTELDGNAVRVRRGGLKYFYYMARSGYFVNNVNFSDSYVKRSGQIEIQTMHGTPLKTLGLDVPGELETKESRDRFLRRRARWDYLVVQSEKAEAITASCYAYKKKYLETGYPRNDSLFARNNEETIRELKKRLGLSLDKKVVLYAPTWRVRNSFDLELDFDRLIDRLGDRFEFALRVHQFAYPGMDKSKIPSAVHDVSCIEDMEDLLLVSDVLITDYSSVMFDYALLRRPMLFYVYDLEKYRDSLRGFNVDLESEAPGPLLKTTDDVISALLNLSALELSSKGAFDRFYNTYCSFEEGRACEKIYEIVFGENR